MKTIKLLFCLMMLSVCAQAQTFQYEKIKNDTYLQKSDEDFGTVYLYNQLEMSLPKSCSSATVKVAAIRQTLLDCVFKGLGEKVKDKAGVLNLMKRKPVRADMLSDNDWRPSKGPANDDAQVWAAVINVKQLSVYNGVVFFLHDMDGHQGGVSWTDTRYIGIDMKTGKAVSASRFFTPAKQKAILRLLTRPANLQRYSDISDRDESNEIARSIKSYIAENKPFPSYYIKGKNLYLTFEKYSIGYGAMGCPTFTLPLSVAQAAK